MLQEGIYYQKGTTPGKHLSLIFLRLNKDKSTENIRQDIEGLWKICHELKKGRIKDLPGVDLPIESLSILIGYGKNIFSIDGLNKTIPSDLNQFGSFRKPKANGGGKLLIGSGLSYSNKVYKNVATEDIVLQFIGDTELSVSRPVVEIWKFISDTDNDIELSKFYKGFQREDHRSWIDFHDGISNMKSGDERFDAISIKPSTGLDNWTELGTYLTFIRLSVNLKEWRYLSLKEQEIAVGRMKLTGCPVEKIKDSVAFPSLGCPFTGTNSITDKINGKYVNKSFFEPPVTVDLETRLSHVQRANQHRSPSSSRDSLRVFRQGYEFLEHIDEYPGFSAGLNFISFQDTPERIQRMLTQPTWLGNTNFGGKEDDENPKLDSLLEVLASGIYFVPPVNENESFPGEIIFKQIETAHNNV
ncbi:Dyp-type peroxidase [Cryomorphaceae bacterium 1068]|nr:Dyp-type peroxidase [Cryomorphaceae bacterium 1068]